MNGKGAICVTLFSGQYRRHGSVKCNLKFNATKEMYDNYIVGVRPKCHNKYHMKLHAFEV